MTACPACTFLNESQALACATCGEELRDTQNTKACPRCTFANSRDAASCEACSLDFGEQDWSCSSCDRTTSDGVLECGHRACFTCHVRWIAACDDEGREPTCLTCDANSAEDKVLSENSMLCILGADAYDERAARLAERACTLYYCPTPGCNQAVELDGDVESRMTTCTGCNKIVTLRRTSDAELIGAGVEAAPQGRQERPEQLGGVMTGQCPQKHNRVEGSFHYAGVPRAAPIGAHLVARLAIVAGQRVPVLNAFWAAVARTGGAMAYVWCSATVVAFAHIVQRKMRPVQDIFPSCHELTPSGGYSGVRGRVTRQHRRRAHGHAPATVSRG